MIYRKPTRIELKRETDMEDYEKFKQDMVRRNKVSRLYVAANETTNFLTPSSTRNRDYLSSDRMFGSKSNYLSGGSAYGDIYEDYEGGFEPPVEEPEYHDQQTLVHYLISSSRATGDTGRRDGR